MLQREGKRPWQMQIIACVMEGAKDDIAAANKRGGLCFRNHRGRLRAERGRGFFGKKNGAGYQSEEQKREKKASHQPAFR